ncbi:unnamed protein product [Dracunculus medinensis]|uniref:DUF2012 domain-containing protein n=1 Tax=Dracunculus medinensis TaxID=318479 RepID=A0A0N4UJQ9_DRAME|nr:unnamed protein product [Dracunculus medinensis]
MIIYKCAFFIIIFPITISVAFATETTPSTYNIEGQIVLADSINAKSNWHINCRVLANYGEYVGFVRKDGSFLLTGVLPGSYIVEISHINYVFEPVRVDITSKGKFRARRLNLLQPSVVSALPYPLKLVASHQITYFRPREEWHLMDMLSSPMVLMMVIPLLLLVIFPKLINTNDPEVKKEMAKSMPQMDVPDVSDMLASWLGGNPKKTSKKILSNKKRIIEDF